MTLIQVTSQGPCVSWHELHEECLDCKQPSPHGTRRGTFLACPLRQGSQAPGHPEREEKGNGSGRASNWPLLSLVSHPRGKVSLCFAHPHRSRIQSDSPIRAWRGLDPPLLFRRPRRRAAATKTRRLLVIVLAGYLDAALRRGARSEPSSLPLLPFPAPRVCCCCCCRCCCNSVQAEARRKGGGIIVAIAPSGPAPCTCQDPPAIEWAVPCSIQLGPPIGNLRAEHNPPSSMSPLSASSSATALSSPRGLPGRENMGPLARRNLNKVRVRFVRY